MEKKTPNKRIMGLSYAKFEEEFGFKPRNKIEQKLFALKGRKPDARLLAAMEKIDEMMKRPPQEPQPLP